jgi:hypothetical protein
VLLRCHRSPMHGPPHDVGAQQGWARSPSARDRRGADSTAVTDADDDERTPEAGSRPALRLHAVRGPLAAAEPPPQVRLVREFKGPTVADLMCEDVAERLPGRVASALRALERGDLAAAERALPGEFAPLLAGPGHRRSARARAARIAGTTVVVAIAATVAAAMLAWLVS